MKVNRKKIDGKKVITQLKSDGTLLIAGIRIQQVEKLESIQDGHEADLYDTMVLP